MLEFQSLASSSAGCCYRLSGGGAAAPLLIDAGLRFDQIRRGCEFRVTGLAGCLLTHSHGDHARSVVELMDCGVDVYASKETWDDVERRSGKDPYTYMHRAVRVPARERFMVGDWSALPFEAVHDAPGTLGFLIAAPDGSRLLFLTDSAYCPYTFDGLTHLAIECNYSSELIRENTAAGTVGSDRFRRTVGTHMSLETLLGMLAANDLSRVEEIHLLHLSSENSDAAGFKTAVERATGKPVYVAAELSV